MLIVLIAGFMGSGKTTALSALSRNLAEQHGLRVSALVGGEVKPGVEIILSSGSAINPLLDHGCVSCLLGSTTLEKMREIKSKEHPDVVLVELPGLAAPGVMRAYLSGSPDLRDEKIIVITVVDVFSPEKLHEGLDYLFETMIYDSNVILLNRADGCEEGEMENFRSRLLKTKGDVEVFSNETALDIKEIDLSVLTNRILAT